MLNESVFYKNISGVDDDPWSNLNVPYTIAEILVAIAAIVGNLLVIVVYLKERRLRKRTKYYIISLAIADLLVGFFGIPFAILASVGLPQNSYLCLFDMSLLVVLCTISIYCLLAVSVDRYWAILYPLSYSRNVRSKTAIEIIIVCWLTGALVGFLPLFGWNEKGSPDRKCFFVDVMNYDYLVFLYFSTIIAPAVLLAAFYAHIYRVVLRQIRQMMLLSSGCSIPKNNSGKGPLRLLGTVRKKEVKAIQNLFVIVLFFVICWFPLYTINFVKALCRDCDVSPTLTNSCIILSHLNSSFNPFLYAYHLKDFRVALHNLVFGHSEISSGRRKSSLLQRFRSRPQLRTDPSTMGKNCHLEGCTTSDGVEFEPEEGRANRKRIDFVEPETRGDSAGEERQCLPVPTIIRGNLSKQRRNRGIGHKSQNGNRNWKTLSEDLQQIQSIQVPFEELRPFENGKFEWRRPIDPQLLK